MSTQKTIILDTNFVMIPFSHKVDIYDQIKSVCAFGHKLVVFDGTLAELDNIITQGGQVGSNAKASKQLLIQKLTSEEITVLPGQHTHVDDDIVDYVQTHPNCIVATQDKGLKKRIKAQLLVLRNEKFVQLQ